MRKSKISIAFATFATLGMLSELHGIKEILLCWVMFFLATKVMWFAVKMTCSAFKGGFHSVLSPTFEKNLENNIYSWMVGSSHSESRVDTSAADQRVWNHTKAMNNAAYQAYQARKANAYNPNSYDAYVKNNRARNARNEANKPY